MIIIREKNAKQINLNLLNNVVKSGIAWFDGEVVKYEIDYDEIKKLIEYLNQNNFPYLLYFSNDEKEKDNNYLSLIPGVGVVLVDNQNNANLPSLLSEYALNRKNGLNYFTDLEIWNSFLKEFDSFQDIEADNILIMLTSGVILNENMYNGYYKNANKLWYSEDIDILKLEENNMSMMVAVDNRYNNIEEVILDYDNNKILKSEDFFKLNKEEILTLMVHYPELFADLIKYKQSFKSSTETYTDEIVYDSFSDFIGGETYQFSVDTDDKDDEHCESCQDPIDENDNFKDLNYYMIEGKSKPICDNCCKGINNMHSF